MTQDPSHESPGDPSQEPEEQPSADAPEEVHSFGDAAAEMANETEVEEPLDVAPADPADDELTVARMALEERTLDLQRLQAEFLNYKRRVDRDRDLIKENATFAALAPITEVLDNIDRARQHGPLDDGFRSIAEQLERVVAGQGLVRYGAPGDAFDPTIHDALSHLGEDPEVEVTTVKVVAKGGYKIGERVVQAAQVLVVDPAESGPATGSTED
ncbi:molecular chaperone GrpE [Nocardioides sp. Soil797]|nr:molecular chaperone GrpE [Nocardioides sp. Soil797]